MTKVASMFRLIAGFVLLIVGGILALPIVPGPGIPLILLGLMLLSSRYAWAESALGRLRHLLDSIRHRRFRSGFMRAGKEAESADQP